MGKGKMKLVIVESPTKARTIGKFPERLRNKGFYGAHNGFAQKPPWSGRRSWFFTPVRAGLGKENDNLGLKRIRQKGRFHNFSNRSG